MTQPPPKPPRRKRTHINGKHAPMPRKSAPGVKRLHDRTQGDPGQGIVEDERGQDQPADKRRAARNR